MAKQPAPTDPICRFAPDKDLTDSELRKLDELLSRYWSRHVPADTREAETTAAIVLAIRVRGRNLISSRRKANKPRGPHKLTPRMVTGLQEIADTGRSYYVDGLTMRGLIERIPHGETGFDWHWTNYRLTDAGRAELDRLNAETAS